MTHFVHPSATLTGRVTLGEGVSIWPGASVRGDRDDIIIGKHSNVQDCVVIHCDPGLPTKIGERVTLGHGAVVHGCTIGDDCLIGIGAVVLNGAMIGEGSIVGAGAVVLEGMKVPPGSVLLGVPARVVRQVDEAMRERQRRTVQAYLELQKRYAAGEFPAYPAGRERGPQGGGVWV